MLHKQVQNKFFIKIYENGKIYKRRNKMARRNSAVKRDVLPDPIYGSKLLTKLINQVMLDGKKSIAEDIVYGAFDIIKEKTGAEPLTIFTEALENVKPVLETKGRRVGGLLTKFQWKFVQIDVKPLVFVG